MSVLNRVAITGLSALSGLGQTVGEHLVALRAGASGVRLIPQEQPPYQDRLPFPYPVSIAGLPPAFSLPEQLLSAREQQRVDRFCHYGLWSAAEAATCSLKGEFPTSEELQHQISSTGLKQQLQDKLPYHPWEMGVILGNGMGGFPFLEREFFEFSQRPRAKTTPYLVPAIIPNMAAGLISMQLGLQGANWGITSACASAGHALMEAYHLIKLGKQQWILAGGTEAVTTKFALGGFHSMRALSTRAVAPELASCPFSLQRDGFVLGEGAALLVLENWDSALKRGATIWGELVGAGFSSDAYHISAPDPAGQWTAHCMNQALADAQLKNHDIDYLNAHGTSTPLGDVAETKAIKQVFGPSAPNLAISSTKSMSGHLLGAAAGLESTICVLSLLHQEVYPTINLTEPDPQCDLNYTPIKCQPRPLTFAMNNAFGFGGTNVSLIFKKTE